MTKVSPNMQNTDKPRRRLSPQVSTLLADRNGPLPIWVRAPVQGPEYFTGFTRSKLYEIAGAGLIRSVSIREGGAVKGVRLFDLASVIAYIEKQVAKAEALAQAEADKPTEAVQPEGCQ